MAENNTHESEIDNEEIYHVHMENLNDPLPSQLCYDESDSSIDLSDDKIFVASINENI